MSDLDLDAFEGHTPGPWRPTGRIPADGLWIRTHAEGQEYHIVASVPASGSPRTLADGYLIAAAPALLAEVRRLRAATLPPDLMRAALLALLYLRLPMPEAREIGVDLDEIERTTPDLTERAREALRMFPEEAKAGV